MRLGSLNSVIVLGRLTRDFDVKTVGDNKDTMVRAGIAINRHYRAEDGQEKTETCYIDIEAWRRTAENLVRNFAKGDAILIRGRLRLNQWKDRSTNETHRRHVIYIEGFENIKENDGRADENAETLLPD